MQPGGILPPAFGAHNFAGFPPQSFPPPGFVPTPSSMFFPGFGFPSLSGALVPSVGAVVAQEFETPYTGRPDPSTIPRQDPSSVNTGVPLHPLESLAPEGRTVYVTNIPSIITEPQLMDFLSVAGPVTKIRMGREEHQPLRYAFVEYTSVRDCHTAIGMTGVICCGRALRIAQSKHAIQSSSTGSLVVAQSANKILTPEEADRMDRTVHISNISSALSDDQVKDFVGLCGKIIHYKISGDASQDNRYAVVEFDTQIAAANCKAISGSSLGGCNIKCGDAKGLVNPSTGDLITQAPFNSGPFLAGQNPSQEAVARTIYVGNLDVTTTDSDLKAFFEERVGPVAKTNILEGATDSYRYGFVEFQDRNHANTAMAFTGQMIGSSVIKVSQSRGFIMKTATANLALMKDPGTQSLVELNNQAYALALQDENRKYQEYLAKKMQKKERK